MPQNIAALLICYSQIQSESYPPKKKLGKNESILNVNLDMLFLSLSQ